MKFTAVLTMLLTLAVAAPTPQEQHDTLAIAKREPGKGKNNAAKLDAIFYKKKSDYLKSIIRR